MIFPINTDVDRSVDVSDTIVIAKDNTDWLIWKKNIHEKTSWNIVINLWIYK